MKFAKEYVRELLTILQPKAIRTRMWEFCVHPSVRYHQPPTKLGFIEHFPSDGNVYNQKAELNCLSDYKTPYEKSRYFIQHVRVIVKEPEVTIYDQVYDKDPISRLIRFGLLRPEDRHKPEKVSTAAKLGLKHYGFDSANHKKYLRTKDSILFSYFDERPEEETYNIQYQKFLNQTERLFTPQPLIDYECGYNSELISFQSLDLYCDPDSMVTIVQNEYLIEEVARQNVKKGHFKLTKGEENFWKALDDSNDATSIVQVQNHLQDQKPLDFRLRSTYAPLKVNKEGIVEDILPLTIERPK